MYFYHGTKIKFSRDIPTPVREGYTFVGWSRYGRTMTEAEANEYGNVNYETAKEDKNYSGKWYFYECLYEITNNATFKMPMTGDEGKWKYGFIGLGIVMAISAGFVICNTRNKKAKKRKHRK